GHILAHGPLSRDAQLQQAATLLRGQIRAYGDLIQQGDRLGVIVPRQDDRDLVYQYLEEDPELTGKSQIIRANTGDADDRDFNPAFDSSTPISILTVHACKGIEFRAVHWLFCEDLAWHYNHEHYYTVVTRAKTSLDLYFTTNLPEVL